MHMSEGAAGHQQGPVWDQSHIITISLWQPDRDVKANHDHRLIWGFASACGPLFPTSCTPHPMDYFCIKLGRVSVFLMNAVASAQVRKTTASHCSFQDGFHHLRQRREEKMGSCRVCLKVSCHHHPWPSQATFTGGAAGVTFFVSASVPWGLLGMMSRQIWIK